MVRPYIMRLVVSTIYMGQGLVAINSILRDWVKGQITAVECGVMSFEAVFMPHMLTNDGRPLVERLNALDMLPPPTEAAAGSVM